MNMRRGHSPPPPQGSPERTINPILAMQGILKYASGISSLSGTSLAFLVRADEILRGLDDAGGFARTRSDAFTLAECSVRCALNEIEAVRSSDQSYDRDEITWLNFVKTDEKQKLLRLEALLGKLLSGWPRDEKRLHAADRASGVLIRHHNEIASEQQQQTAGPAGIWCDASYASAAAALVHGVVGALYSAPGTSDGGGGLISTASSEATKKRKRNLPLSGGGPDSVETSSLKRASSEQRLSIKESKSETELGHIFTQAAKISDGSTTPPLLDHGTPPTTVLIKKENEGILDAKQIEALVCTARAELANADAMSRADDHHRASRAYRGALARLEIVRGSADLDLRRDTLLKKTGLKAAQRARSCGHILENSTVEHRCFIQLRRTSSVSTIMSHTTTRPDDDDNDETGEERQSLLVHRRSDEKEYSVPDDLFSSDEESSDDEELSMAFSDPKWCGAAGPHEFILSSKSCHTCLNTTTASLHTGVGITVSKKRSTKKRGSHTAQGKDRRLEDVYQISESTLGKGSYGLVKSCQRILDGEKFACKTIDFPREISDAAIERIHAEIAAMRKLDHPHICRLHDVFFAKRRVHLIMDLCEGGELWQRVVDRSGMDEPMAAALCKQMLSAVRYMHASGVCHRDLKPQNWLFATRDLDAPLKLVDFGLAKHFSEKPPALGRTTVTRSDSRRKSRRIIGDSDEYDDDDIFSKSNNCCSTFENFLSKKTQQRTYYFGGPQACDAQPKSPVPQESLTPRTVAVTGNGGSAESEFAFEEDDGIPSILSEQQQNNNDLNDEQYSYASRSREDGSMVVAPETQSSSSQGNSMSSTKNNAHSQQSVATEAAARARAMTRRYLSDRVGSFYFVAPEVLRGSHDARCDLWSLGIIVYMLLSGVPPFGGKTDRDILARVAGAKLTFPPRLFSTVSAQARLFVARLLDRDVDRRLTAEQALQESWIIDNGRHIEQKRPAIVIRDVCRQTLSSRVLDAVRKFARIDALTKLTVCVAACRLPAQKLEQARADLAVFDADGDGTLSLSEFFDALGGGTDTALLDDETNDEDLSMFPPLQNREKMDLDLEDNDDGRRRLPKLQIETKPTSVPISIEEAAALFDATDFKADGQCVSFREFVAATASYQIIFTPALLRDVFTTLDAVGRGYLTSATLRNFVGTDRCVGADDRIDAARAFEMLTGSKNAKLGYPAFAHAVATNLTTHGFMVGLDPPQIPSRSSLDFIIDQSDIESETPPPVPLKSTANHHDNNIAHSGYNQNQQHQVLAA